MVMALRGRLKEANTKKLMMVFNMSLQNYRSLPMKFCLDACILLTD